MDGEGGVSRNVSPKRDERCECESSGKYKDTNVTKREIGMSVSEGPAAEMGESVKEV